MKALTIIQPFAELIARGVKRVENRSWPTSYRGPLLIHAGKSKRYNGEPVADIAVGYGIDPASLVFGAAVAVATLVDCVKLEPGIGLGGDITPTWAREKYPWLDDHEHREGPYCWIVDEVHRLERPVAVNGEQGLWTPKPELLAAVNDVLSLGSLVKGA